MSTAAHLPPDITYYRGRFNEDILSFLPERGAWRHLINNRDSVICKNHPSKKGEKYIAPGDSVVAIKWCSGHREGQEEWRVFFYCSLQCQQTHRVMGNFGSRIKKKLAPKP